VLIMWFGFTLTYKLWLARNEAGDSARLEAPMAIAVSAEEAVKEWLSLKTPSMPKGSSPRERWLCP
jgi:hypothetical protein